MHRFRSRVSVIIVLLLVGSIVSVFFLEPGSYVHLPENLFLTLLLLGGLVGFLLFGISYEINETHVCIRLGPFRYGHISVDRIRTIERSYIFLSAPAASLKRLLIESDNRTLLISPANEEEFIRLLKNRNQSIQLNVEDKKGWWRFWDWDI